MYKPVAVLGFGPAAVNAVIALRDNGYDGDVCVFTAGDAVPYSPILTSYYAGGIKEYDECFPWSSEEIADLQVDVLDHCVVERLDANEHLLTTSHGQFTFGKCLVATGSSPVTRGLPPVEGCEEFTPFVLRTMQDAAQFRAVLEDSQCTQVLVCGASMVALKMVESCLDQGKQVTLSARKDQVLSAYTVPRVAERFQARLQSQGVTLQLGVTIERMRLIDRDKYSAGDTKIRPVEVVFSDGTTAVFDAVALAYGMTPNVGFVDDSLLAKEGASKEGEVKEGASEKLALKEGASEKLALKEGALVVDDFMRTNNKDVYAAGDVALARDCVTGAPHKTALWKSAALQGACAGATMAADLAGKPRDTSFAYEGFVSSNTVIVDDALFIAGGVSSPLSPDAKALKERGEGLLCFDVTDECDSTVCRVYAQNTQGKKRLVGFSLATDHNHAGSDAYDLAGMLLIQIEREAKAANAQPVEELFYREPDHEKMQEAGVVECSGDVCHVVYPADMPDPGDTSGRVEASGKADASGSADALGSANASSVAEVSGLADVSDSAEAFGNAEEEA